MHSAIYLAGPLGFTEAGRYFHTQVVVPKTRALGVTVLDPWPAAAEVFSKVTAGSIDVRTANLLVGRQNEEMIRASSWLIAVLDGSDVDSGTAAEIGFAAALGKPVVGTRSDLRMSGDNSATPVNLQVAYFIELSQGAIVPSIDDAVQWIGKRLNGPHPA